MPTYEYQCKQCGHVFERSHAIGEKKKYQCPECSCSRTKKLISQVGVIFKGSGFYATDSRKGNGCANSGTCKRKAAETEKSSDTPCEICPADEN